ncbi:MAG: hypothetical protein EHM42_02415 [Planctomycetaceae bacterium]|nr:MAG: hypothetical protein EHM42_02415 [Planctomycetaceae bacterium]
MSETASHSPASAAGQVLSTPEFDAREIEQFSEKDAKAITVIGKMLVAFFFYSFIVMVFVGYWTMSKGGQQKPPHAAGAGAHHGAGHADEEE